MRAYQKVCRNNNITIDFISSMWERSRGIKSESKTFIGECVCLNSTSKKLKIEWVQWLNRNKDIEIQVNMPFKDLVFDIDESHGIRIISIRERRDYERGLKDVKY